MSDNPVAVTVAYIHPNEVAQSFHQSLMNLAGYDMSHNGHVMAGGWVSAQLYGADGLPGARNTVVKRFLTETDSDWLFWIDTDIGFTPDTVDKLLAVADAEHRPIVGGLCFVQKQLGHDGMGGYTSTIVPTIYEWNKFPNGNEGFVSRGLYPVNKVIQCAGTGSACILIHRSVFTRIAEKYGQAWYDRVPNPTVDNKLMGEDLSFCLRAGALGIPTYVHTGVRTSHFKPSWLSEREFWRQVVPEPAAERTAVLVPVYGRPAAAEPFMRSLRASTGLGEVYAIAGPEDAPGGREASVEAWQKAGAQVIVAEGPSYAEKINLGYRLTDEPWLVMVGDDVRFYPGWLDHIQVIAGDQYHVIGTNDLGPRTVDGQDSPHIAFRRTYLDEHGASWDGPQVVCHEGYRHACVDLEIALVAKQRKVWAMAPGSVVEHLHPAWNKAEVDEVYKLGASFGERDNKLFRKRMRKYAPEVLGEV